MFDCSYDELVCQRASRPLVIYDSLLLIHGLNLSCCCLVFVPYVSGLKPNRCICFILLAPSSSYSRDMHMLNLCF